MATTDQPRPTIAVVDTAETIYFSHARGCDALRQWLEVTISHEGAETVAATATVSAAGEDVTTGLELRLGTHTYRCYGSVLWPRWPAAEAALTIRVGGTAIEARVSVGRHRPWSLYLLGDDCVDYTWAYDDIEREIADSAATTRAEIAACRGTATAPWAEQNRHNLIHSVELAFFLREAGEAEEAELAELVRQGRLSLSAYHTMAMTANLSLPEAIRQFYPAARFARKWSLPLLYANHQETPTISWSQASLLAGAGVRYLVKSNFAYCTPWNDRLQEPPIFVWEGPDGARVLVRRRNPDYVEGAFVLKGAEATGAAVADEVAELEALGDSYPFSAAGLVGCYGDLSPRTPTLAAVKLAGIEAYNAGGWEYPRLVNASHALFWEEIERQIEQSSLTPPVYRGDYGTSWEVWAISLAHSFAGWRRAQERATEADALAALASWADPGAWTRLEPLLDEGWRHLLLLSDHAWNGSGDASRHLNAGLRQRWQAAANASFDAAIDSVLACGAAAGAAGPAVAAVNSLGWQRDGLVRFSGDGLPAGPLQAVDDGGGAVPVQEWPSGEGRHLAFLARAVPALGSRAYRLSPAAAGPLAQPQDERAIENDYYRVEVGGEGGAITSIWDKRRGREVVTPGPGGLGRAFYGRGEREAPLPLAWEARREVGPAGARLVVHGHGEGIEVETCIELHQGLDQVAIENRVRKIACDEPELLSFAFPLDVPGARYLVEGPGVTYAPGDVDRGGEQRPGSGQGVQAVRHCVDLYGDDFGVTLAQVDGGIVRFGRVGVDEAPREPDRADTTVYALALGSAYNHREVSHDQGGATEFRFRYALRAHDGGGDPAATVRFGAEVATDLAVAAAGPQVPSLCLQPHDLLLVELKVADEGIGRGLMARLWNPTRRPLSGQLALQGGRPIGAAWLTDLVECDREALTVVTGVVTVDVPARGYATVRLLPAAG